VQNGGSGVQPAAYVGDCFGPSVLDRPSRKAQINWSCGDICIGDQLTCHAAKWLARPLLTTKNLFGLVPLLRESQKRKVVPSGHFRKYYAVGGRIVP
jgi:hypothetical protein